MAVSVPLISGGVDYTYSPGVKTPDSQASGSAVTTGGFSPSYTDQYVPSGPEASTFIPPYGPFTNTSARAARTLSSGTTTDTTNASGTTTDTTTASGATTDTTTASAGSSSPAVGGAASAGSSAAVSAGQCETCAARKYKDVSNDSGVSFQSATHVAPEAAATAVSSHESEHVLREQMKATANDETVVNQYVMIETDVCPECGKVYVSGGSTTTVTKSQSDSGGQGINVTV